MTEASVCHEPGDHPMWQESMAFVFCDEQEPWCGTAAFGTFVNRRDGLSWLGVGLGGADTLVYQRSRNGIALTGDDRRADRLGVGGVHWEAAGPGRGMLTATDEDARVELEFFDFYPLTSWHAASGSLETLAAGHAECSGRVTGQITVDGRTVQIDGWGHRDQSWGPRTTDIIRNHRWVAGSCGPELGFSAEALHLDDGTMVTMGFVARDGVVERAPQVENLVTFDHDGLTPRRFESRLTLEGGEELTIESDEILVYLYNDREPLVAIDAIARVRCGPVRGFADLNLIANPQAGSQAPSRLLGAPLEDGVHRLSVDGLDAR